MRRWSVVSRTVMILVIATAGACLGAGPDPITSPTPKAPKAGATGLSSDASHEVIVIPQGDLVVRYKKNATGPVRIYVKPEVASFVTTAKALKAFRLYEDWSAIEAVGTACDVAIECYASGALFPSPQTHLSAVFSGKHPQLEAVARDRAELAQMLGLDARALAQVTAWKVLCSSDMTVVFWSTQRNDYVYAFKPGGSTTGPVKTLAPTCRIGDLEIQSGFNSLNPATSSVDINAPTNRTFNW